ncbi:telomerase inhibitor [Cytospora paraplurivora]|uniref:Telomerase inhibitor n=1 Tax=Cytospora paraplurivora TaxID=2898453 RepID=A0AAN9U611_9PEZI
MAPPKSYADTLRGARGPTPSLQTSPSPKTAAMTTAASPSALAPLPVLEPSSSFSSVLLADSEPQAWLKPKPQPKPQPHDQRKQQQQKQSCDTDTGRTYASALKGIRIQKRQGTQATMEELPVSSPSPSPSLSSEPGSEFEAEPEPAGLSLWESSDGYDVVIVCGELRWYVHRYVLERMSEFMQEYLPPEAEDGRPVVWYLNPKKWHGPMLSNVLRYMYVEAYHVVTPEYDNCDYDADNPLDTESINLNVNYFVAGASVHCRPMMDHALSRLEEAREEIREVADNIRHANLDSFQSGILGGLLSMWDQPDQWRLLSLRIVMGKLMAVAFPIILQSPHWATKYKPSWGDMYFHAVADHMWLHTAGFCPHVPAITTGFEHMQIMWVKYRPNGWKLEDDIGFSAGRVPPSLSLPSPPHRSADPRGRGRGDQATRPVQLGNLVSSCHEKGAKKDKGNTVEDDEEKEEAIAGTTDNTGPTSAAEGAAMSGSAPIAGPPLSAGPYPVEIQNPAASPAIMLDRPMPVGFLMRPGSYMAAGPMHDPQAVVPEWTWPQVPPQPLYSPQPSFTLPVLPPSPTILGLPASPTPSRRPKSSGQLSATAEPFKPGVRAAVTEPSSLGSFSPSVLDSPILRLSDLYVADEKRGERA